MTVSSPQFTLWLTILLASCSTAPQNATLTEQDQAFLFQADPTIFVHQGTYYLYGTNGLDADQGFQVYTSTDRQRWEGPKGVKDGYALRQQDVYGDKGFWAPQVFYYNNRFYMAYTANEHIAIATSNSPLGPFVQDEKKPIITDGKNIDPYVFFDQGKAYLYHVRLRWGNRIYVAEMTDDLLNILPQTLAECISGAENRQPWEVTEQSWWTVTEGPTVLKRQGVYYLFYSANDFRNPDYAVGYATADNPLGPWKKYAHNPIISAKSTGENGSGHGDFFIDEEENLHYVFHTHFDKQHVGPRKTALMTGEWANGRDGETTMHMDSSTFHFLLLPGEDG